MEERTQLFDGQLPTILTERLRLRRLEERDAPRVQEFCSAREIAATTLRIPHPYPEDAALEFIRAGEGLFRRRELVSLAIAERESDLLIGGIGLILHLDDDRGELGYWMGMPYWGRGFVTEAVRALTEWGFARLGLAKVYAVHFENNAASGRVLQKAGLRYEATLRKHILKWGERLDLHFYCVLREEWEARRTAERSGAV